MITVEGLDAQLQHIARQVVQKHGNPRVEFDDMLQEARIAAWQAIGRAPVRGVPDAERERYALGAARKECERVVARMKKDPLFHAENYGLYEDLEGVEARLFG